MEQLNKRHGAVNAMPGTRRRHDDQGCRSLEGIRADREDYAAGVSGNLTAASFPFPTCGRGEAERRADIAPYNNMA
jgi:hypothetical protein